MSFGENLKKIRCELGLTQEELAGRISISAQAVSKWERGESMPYAATLSVIADALGVSLDRLFGRKSEGLRDMAYHINAFINGSGESNSIRNIRRISHIASCMTTSLSHDMPGEAWDTAGRSHPVYILGNDGYVLGDNNPSLPFLCIFEEPEAGWRSGLSSPDAYRILSELSAPGVIEAVCKLNEHDYITFDEAYAKGSLGIDADTISHLRSLGVLRKSELEINGTMTTLYHSCPAPALIALLIIAAHYDHNDQNFDISAFNRSAPLIR